MDEINNYKSRFEDFFIKEMKDYFHSDLDLDKACLYSLFAGGKRIRPILTMMISEFLNSNQTLALHYGCAVEMIHTYSLIHDDLPAMDNDDYRRGKLTCHKVYGEAMAILAGDALLTEAPLYLNNSCKLHNISSVIRNKSLFELLDASGREGMIKGQILDIINENKDHTNLSTDKKLELIKDIHNHKTGKLFALSCVLGVLTKEDFNEEKDNELINCFRDFGLSLGLLFQIRDDILDTTQSFQELGKTPGKDEASGKLTYVSILTLDGAISMAKDLNNFCNNSLEKMEHKKDFNSSKTLRGLLDFLAKDIY